MEGAGGGRQLSANETVKRNTPRGVLRRAEEIELGENPEDQRTPYSAPKATQAKVSGERRDPVCLALILRALGAAPPAPEFRIAHAMAQPKPL